MHINTEKARQITCEVFGITPEEFASSKRTARIAYARHALSHALTGHLGYTHEDAALVLGRTRSNVTHGIQTSRALFDVNKQYAELLKELMCRLEETINYN